MVAEQNRITFGASALPIPNLRYGMPLFDPQSSTAGSGRIKTKPDLLRVISKAGVLDDDALASLRGAKDGAEAVKLLKTNGAVLSGLSDADVARIWSTPATIDATKTVRITVDADAGEEVEVSSPQAEPDDTEAMDDEEEDGEKSARPTSQKARLADPDGKAMGRKLMKAGGFGKPMGGTVRKHRLYNKAVSSGGTFRGKAPVFGDAEQAEAFGAWARTTAFPNLEYKARRGDREILASIGTKALGNNVNETGGFAVPEEFSSELIELLPKYGAVRRACGVVTMPRETWVGPRITDDVDVAVLGEGSAGTTQNKPTGDNVRLDARTLIAIVPAQEQWLNDAAVDAADMIARSMARGQAKFEDLNFLRDRSITGTSPSFQGVGDKLGSNTKHDAAYTAWGDYTVSDDTTLRSLLCGRAHGLSERIGYIMSAGYYAANFEKVGLSAGGAQPLDFTAGIRARDTVEQYQADALWNGKPVWFTQAMPVTYTDGQVGALYGAWDIAVKFGEVANSMTIAASEHRYFEYGQTAFRLMPRVAFNAHDVNDSVDAETGSLVVGLQD